MVLPTPPSPNQPIPKSPFYTPTTSTISGEQGVLVIGNGLYVDPTTGRLNVVGATTGGAVEQIVAGNGIQVTNGGIGITTISNTGVINLVAGVGIQVTPSGTGTYTISNVYTAPSGNGTVTSITAGPGLLGGTITTTGTISLPPTGVSPSTYTNPTLTVDAYGRITAITPGQTTKSIIGTAPITVAGGNTNVATIGILPASTFQPGVVRLSGNPASTATDTAPNSFALNQVLAIAQAAQQGASGGMPITGGTFTGPVIFAAGQTFPGTVSTSIATIPGAMLYVQSPGNFIQLVPGIPGEVLVMSAGAPVWTNEIYGGTF